MAARALSGCLDICRPDQVAEDLALALGALLHAGLRHPAGAAACADCSASGRIVAPRVGRALFASRRARRGFLKAQDYNAIGGAVETLEHAAGTRTATGKRPSAPAARPAPPAPEGAILSPPPCDDRARVFLDRPQKNSPVFRTLGVGRQTRDR